MMPFDMSHRLHAWFAHYLHVILICVCLIVLFFLPFPYLFFWGGDTDTVDLTVDTFDDFIDAHPLTVVMFHAPWCKMCQQWKPHYIEASHRLVKDNIVLVRIFPPTY